jgi:hypothetical protein
MEFGEIFNFVKSLAREYVDRYKNQMIRFSSIPILIAPSMFEFLEP